MTSRSSKQKEKSISRLQVMCDTNDGFKIAEADLKNRGAGDLIGTQQAGSNKYVQLMLANPEKYMSALDASKIILDQNLQCPILTKLLDSRSEKENSMRRPGMSSSLSQKGQAD